MFTFSRVDTDSGALQMELLFSELDSRRSPEQRLSADTLRLMASRYDQFCDQYLTFPEFPELNDASITHFLNAADAVDKISNHTLRGNAMGTFQANIGLWQILARQGQIPSAKLNESWQAVIKPFGKFNSSAQLFDAGRSSFVEIFPPATAQPTPSQHQIL